MLSATKCNYFEGEVIPHVFVYKASNQTPLTNGPSYSFNVTYNCCQQNRDGGGFAYMTTYKISRRPGPNDATNPYVPPTIDSGFTNGGGMHHGVPSTDVDFTIRITGPSYATPTLANGGCQVALTTRPRLT